MFNQLREDEGKEGAGGALGCGVEKRGRVNDDDAVGKGGEERKELRVFNKIGNKN